MEAQNCLLASAPLSPLLPLSSLWVDQLLHTHPRLVKLPLGRPAFAHPQAGFLLSSPPWSSSPVGL